MLSRTSFQNSNDTQGCGFDKSIGGMLGNKKKHFFDYINRNI